MRWSRCFALTVLALGITVVSPLRGQEKKALPAGRATHDAASSDFVGSQTCKECHEEEFKTYDRSPHWKTERDTHAGKSGQGCESCHGAGKAHAEEGAKLETLTRFDKLDARKASEKCLECHEFNESHSNFLRAEHVKNNVGCVDCHSEHKPTIEKALLKENQPKLCYTCHLEVRADFAKPFHHRVNEGLILCSNCHNPHGGFLTRQLRSTAAQDQVCYNCHTEKAGPFVFEHLPAKTEGCVTCHTPHGSTNPRLLTRANVNVLCLECHTLSIDSLAPAAPSFHNQAVKYQACTMCHTQIHGSNTSQVFFK
jgi:DmsE family decaheme c-type cytochrome